MRLTAELIENSLSYINTLKDRELDLRGRKIPAIENLGLAKDQDTIDFTDNDISSVGNFPYFPRLGTLLLARNRINHIQPALGSSLPNLSTITLFSNNLAELADLEPLSTLTQLRHLTLLENPVTRKENYRYWVIWLVPSVVFLDYQKVKQAERIKARELFGTREAPTELAAKIMGIKSVVSVASNGAGAGESKSEQPVRLKLTAAEKKRVQEMILNATSLQEVARLEKDLAEGRVPAGAFMATDDTDGDSTMQM
ncbi:U2 small nuclear ribonucleoprotein A [Penicillium chermesinum]|uniref:U2 small nuclear ribonucleoprotein A' n=1 Tax=Penicillium chermesinum TaxID=63820 RepID=A0A9W9PHQ2_9EURO|nr:U2 small nuclear ribonucleoprotein A [Penicillium chermesinum]KAJ5246362.1 U2 small nuclear ribonucleoprotein A [Penicillium chermesinum]KAJ6144643.1 U2 small nuclear ribonucleoprotein A [Penicillium chermesinum]